jgi:hypothetical protein
MHGREWCFNVPQLRGALGRSGHALLDLEIESCTRDMAVLMAAESTRWGIIRLPNYDNDIETEPITILIKHVPTPTRLQTAKIVGTFDATLPSWLEQTQPPRLELLYCDLSLFAKTSWWAGLCDLRIRESSTDRLMAHSVLEATRLQLTYLEIRGGQRAIYRPPSPLDFPELLEIHLEGVDWWNFRGNKLIKMYLQPNSSPPPNLSVAYPSLIELTYHTGRVMLAQESIIAPRLELLTLHKIRPRDEQSAFPWLNKDGTPSTLASKHLRLVDCKISKQLVKLLCANSKFEQLEMTDCELFIGSVKMFSLCPSLKELLIDPCYFARNVAAERYDTVFLDIIKAKKRNGNPLKRLVVVSPAFLWPTRQNDSLYVRKDYV